ncbi:hypothetical protein I6E18_08070 [Phocaeicola barnesiae]|uniref:Lipoprotein n=1 Tax=Phocaeicola barnesiae TaxID=376804 RepID=A0AAW5N6U4_9BACT|nr:hypothetical protein [Phocaeicola barnesiae]MCF2576124.1 hypothetical protein [Phocaeicola barnesiae]MCF2599573.1 hypothetical protein [Phocaeicola barnesiae]MCR8872820.1 hypothetical protein [Phocaeicola barnesiae]MDM8232635.1 hypothetical protein [Phocaeicola barnesiae]MDM8240886.1 hypothetical protein [Phocaeicola barnesiae]
MTRIILPLDFFLLGATCFPSYEGEGAAADLQPSGTILPNVPNQEDSISQP